MNQKRRTGRLYFLSHFVMNFLKHTLNRLSGAQTNSLLLKSGFWSLSGLTLLVALPSLGWGQGREYDNCVFNTSGDLSLLNLNDTQWDSFVTAVPQSRRYMLVRKTHNVLVCCEIPINRAAIRRNNQFSCYSLQNAGAQAPTPPPAHRPTYSPPSYNLGNNPQLTAQSPSPPPSTTGPNPAPSTQNPPPGPTTPTPAPPSPRTGGLGPGPLASPDPNLRPLRTEAPTPTTPPTATQEAIAETRRQQEERVAITAQVCGHEANQPRAGTAGCKDLVAQTQADAARRRSEAPAVDGGGTHPAPPAPPAAPGGSTSPPRANTPNQQQARSNGSDGATPPETVAARTARETREREITQQRTSVAGTDGLGIEDPCRGAIVAKLYEDWSATRPTPRDRATFLAWAEPKKSAYVADYGCGARRTSQLNTIEGISRVTDATITTTSQILGNIATSTAQNAANQNSPTLHNDAINSQKDLLYATAGVQIGGSAIHTLTMANALSASGDLGNSRDVAQRSLNGTSHAMTVGVDSTATTPSTPPQNIKARRRTEIVGAALSDGAVNSQEELTRAGRDGRAALSSSVESAETLKSRANDLALTEGVKAAMQAATASMYMIQASELRANSDNMRPSDDTVTPFLAGGDHTAPTDRGPLSGPTFSNVGSGDLAVSEATENRDNLPPPPGETLGPMGGGGGSPGGLAGPVSSGGGGGVITAGTTSGAGGGPGSAGGGGGGSGDPSSGESGPEAFNATAGAKFADASNGAGFGAAGSGMGARQKSTGMDIQGLLSQFMPKKEEDRQPASNILEFGKNGAPGAAQGGDNEGGILGPNGDPLFVRVSRQTTAQHKSGNIR